MQQTNCLYSQKPQVGWQNPLKLRPQSEQCHWNQCGGSQQHLQQDHPEQPQAKWAPKQFSRVEVLASQEIAKKSQGLSEDADDLGVRVNIFDMKALSSHPANKDNSSSGISSNTNVVAQEPVKTRSKSESTKKDHAQIQL